MSLGELLAAIVALAVVFAAGGIAGATVMFRGGSRLMRAAARAVREGRPMAALAILDPDTDARFLRALLREDRRVTGRVQGTDVARLGATCVPHTHPGLYPAVGSLDEARANLHARVFGEER